SRQRQVPTIKFTACTRSAAISHGTEALRALAHKRAVSIFEKRNARSATLTAIFAAITKTRRPIDDDGDSSGIRIAADSALYYGFVRKSQVRMRILMIAPEPFFEPRGTPFSEFHRIRALTALGHQVDLVTYPFGQDVAMPGLRVFRSLRPPFIHRVK